VSQKFVEEYLRGGAATEFLKKALRDDWISVIYKKRRRNENGVL
jgi:hypothetical protein